MDYVIMICSPLYIFPSPFLLGTYLWNIAYNTMDYVIIYFKMYIQCHLDFTLHCSSRMGVKKSGQIRLHLKQLMLA